LVIDNPSQIKSHATALLRYWQTARTSTIFRWQEFGVSDKISWHGEKPKRIATQRLRGRRERDIDFILSHAILSILTKRLGVLNVFCVVSWPFEFFSLYLCVSVSHLI
jgi:hypothetical protein